MTAYRELEARFRRIGALKGTIRMLEWGQAAMMPPGGAAAPPACGGRAGRSRRGAFARHLRQRHLS